MARNLLDLSEVERIAQEHLQQRVGEVDKTWVEGVWLCAVAETAVYEIVIRGLTRSWVPQGPSSWVDLGQEYLYKLQVFAETGEIAGCWRGEEMATDRGEVIRFLESDSVSLDVPSAGLLAN